MGFTLKTTKFSLACISELYLIFCMRRDHELKNISIYMYIDIFQYILIEMKFL